MAKNIKAKFDFIQFIKSETVGSPAFKLFLFFLLLGTLFTVFRVVAARSIDHEIALYFSSAASFTLFAAFSVIILSPLAEEIVFRGFIQEILIDRLKGSLGIFSYANILASLLFVAVHMVYRDPIFSLTVFVPSLMFGLLYEKSNRKLLLPILLHALFNISYFIG